MHIIEEVASQVSLLSVADHRFVARMIAHLISAKSSNEVKLESFQLVNHLFRGGNDELQGALLDYLAFSEDEEGFFAALHFHISEASSAMKHPQLLNSG